MVRFFELMGMAVLAALILWALYLVLRIVLPLVLIVILIMVVADLWKEGK